MPKFDIAVVAWNNAVLTGRCLDSIRNYTRNPYRILLVDNASSDEVSRIQSGNDLKVIRNQSNLGWVPACNQAIDEFLSGDADYLVLANNDCEFSPGWDEAWVKHFDADPRVGAVGPVSDNISGSQHVSAADGRKWGSAHFLIYMAVCFSREALKKVGKLDEQFTAGSDDLDHSIRMRDAGYRLIIDRTTVFPHVCHASFSVKLGRRPDNEFWADGKQKLIAKHGEDRVRQVMAPKVAVAVGVPTVTMGPPFWEWANAYAEIFKPDHTKVTLGQIGSKRMIVDQARCKIAELALLHDVDYLYFLDDDTMAPPKTLQAFVEMDKDIIFALTYQRGEPYHPCAMVFNEERKIYHSTPALREGVVEVDAVGMAATLIRSNVLHRMKASNPYLFKFGDPSERLGGQTVGEDMGFCERAKKMGFRVWVDTDRICTHLRSDAMGVNEKAYLKTQATHCEEDFKGRYRLDEKTGLYTSKKLEVAACPS